MKKGFTLIELLTAIIILGLIVLVIAPTTIDTINKSKESANKISANNLIDAANAYYSESQLDSDMAVKVRTVSNIYNDVNVNGKKPTGGQLYINSSRAVALSVMMDGKCYKKEFNGDLEIIKDDECELTYVGYDETEPVVTITTNATKTNDWYNKNLYMNIKVVDTNGGSGADGYQYCVSSTECDPYISISGDSGSIYITSERINYLCVTGFDKAGNYSDTECQTIKLDKTAPEFSGIEDIVIKQGDSIALNSVTAVDSVSGLLNAYTYNPATIDTSKLGTTNVTYSVSDLAGNTNTVTRKITVDSKLPVAIYYALGNKINENGWAKEDFYVKTILTDRSGLGIQEARWCMTKNDRCNPDIEITGTDIIPLIKDEGSNRICVYLKDNNNKENTMCSDAYKLDKTAPVVIPTSSDIVIAKEESHDASSYFTTNYGVSGGSISCIPVNTSGLTMGNQTISCTATSNSGISTTNTKQIKVISEEYYAIGKDNSGANAPVLFNNMIPVVYDKTNWIYADITENWYNYDNHVWANAVVLNSGVTKNVGDTITESEIAQMYVWIPRYKYTIFNDTYDTAGVPVQEIQITFEKNNERTGTVTCTDNIGTQSTSETCTDTNGTIKKGVSTYTHPAFKFGNTELTGIWVGKFENSAANVTSNTIQTVLIKPNVISWRNAQVATFFKSIEKIKTDYSINADSHMMKNMEWGAAAYLKQSKYGLGTTNIVINLNSSYYTGDKAYATNVNQSTTGNIYGIYDMSGGAWEYVMGHMAFSNGEQLVGSNADSTSGFSGKYYNKSDAIGIYAFPNYKYTNMYSYDDSTYTSHSRGKLGDATKETLITYGNATGGWYGNLSGFPCTNSSWLVRGGTYNSGTFAGTFSFAYTYGAIDIGDASRSVITEQ